MRFLEQPAAVSRGENPDVVIVIGMAMLGFAFARPNLRDLLHYCANS